MKKLYGILIIFLIFAVICFLQINVFSWCNIAGVMPNLFVILVLFIGLFMGNKLGIVLGLLFGTILDVIFGRTIGISGVILAIIGYAGEYFDKNFSKDSKMMIIAISVCGTLFYEIAYYFIKYIQFKVEIEIQGFAIKLVLENLFNTLLIIIIYPWLKKLGYHLEDGFKGRKLLTRYF